MFSWLEIAPQCCDANGYLAQGSQCALNGVCYGELRPMGNYYWFSMPARFGWSDNTLVVANIFMVALSIILSVVAIAGLLRVDRKAALRCCLVVVPFTAAIHFWYFRPTLFHTLSDTPAAAMLLCGIWLLMCHFFWRPTRFLSGSLLLLAGFFLGLSVWLRAFYLYPVFFLLLVYIIGWLFSDSKKLVHLLILSALIPLAIQYGTMFKVYGHYSFIKQELSASWQETHLNSVIVGYDTMVYNSGYQWRPKHCEASYGILNSLKVKDAASLFCVLGERLYFYLGTYKPNTYQHPSLKNYLSQKGASSIGDPKSYWSLNNLHWTSGLSVVLDQTLLKPDRLDITVPQPNGSGSASANTVLKEGVVYTFSVWLWSPLSRSINLAVVNRAEGKQIAGEQVLLTPMAKRYAITGRSGKTGVYDLYIGATPTQNMPITFGNEAGDFLFAAAPQIEEGANATQYVAEETVDPDEVRQWSLSLLCINGAMLALFFCVIFCGREFWFYTRTGLGVTTLFLVAGAESIAIIPEQRFVIALMVFFWIIALLPVLKCAVFFNRKKILTSPILR